MIDLHSHILPGVDDGPEDIAESLEMCRMAASDGIKVIVATPHFKPGLFEVPPPALVKERLAELNKAVKEEGLELKILPGAEVRLMPEVWQYVGVIDYLTINCTGRYMLGEFSMHALPEGWRGMLIEALGRGITPVLAHPERNRYFLKDPEALRSVVNFGVMVQLTAESVLGLAGDDIRDFSLMLIKEGLAHVISTDSHSTTIRPPILSKAVEVAAGVVGKEDALKLVTTIPEMIISGVARKRI